MSNVGNQQTQQTQPATTMMGGEFNFFHQFEQP